MKSRFLITLLCVGAVAFACGPRARNDGSATSASSAALSTARTISQQGAPRTSGTSSTKSPVAAELRVSTDAAAIRLALLVVNSGKKTIELTFPSGQTHDFVIIDTLGREVWRWGNGRLFTQALKNKLLSRGESLDMTETWETPTLKAGRYTAIAVLKSENYPIVERAEFVIRGATLATRE